MNVWKSAEEPPVTVAYSDLDDLLEEIAWLRILVLRGVRVYRRTWWGGRKPVPGANSDKASMLAHLDAVEDRVHRMMEAGDS